MILFRPEHVEPILSGRKIPLSRGLVAIVDEDDYEWLSRWRWHATCRGYAARNKPKPERGLIFMHREILELPEGLQGDHINGDKIDNRRCNLRPATDAENHRNRPLRADNSSGFKGVRRRSDCNRWVAEISVGGRYLYLGLFESAVEAARAYNAAAVLHYGEFAWLNEVS